MAFRDGSGSDSPDKREAFRRLGMSHTGGFRPDAPSSEHTLDTSLTKPRDDNEYPRKSPGKKPVGCCCLTGCLAVMLKFGAQYFMAIADNIDIETMLVDLSEDLYEKHVPINSNFTSRVSIEFKMPDGREMTRDEINEAGKVIVNRLPEKWRTNASIVYMGGGNIDVYIPGDVFRTDWSFELPENRMYNSGALEIFHTGAKKITRGEDLQEGGQATECKGNYGAAGRCLLLTGADVKSVELRKDSDGKFAIELELKKDSAAKFNHYKASHPGQYIAISLGGFIISSPVLNRAASGDALMVTGDFDKRRCEDLVAIMRSGDFPAPVIGVRHGASRNRRQ